MDMPDSHSAQSASQVIPCPHCDTLNRVPATRPALQGKCGHCHQALFTGQPMVLDTKRFDRHAGADLPLLVDFWASWCGPCRIMAPSFEAAARAFEPRLRFGKLDTEAEPAIAARFQIRSIPTLVLLRHGNELARVSGALPAGELKRWIEQALATT